MTESEHFDQVAPVGGVQIQPDDSLTVAPIVRPVGMPEDQAFELPSLPPEFESGPQGDELAESIRKQIEVSRQQLAQPAGNLDIQGAPHFLRVLPDGEEVCGQDGQAWPCLPARGLEAQARRTQFGGLPVGRVAPDGSPELLTLGESLSAADVQPGTPTFEDVATALGMTTEQLTRTVKEQQDKIQRGLTRDV